MATTRLTDVFIDPAFNPTPVAAGDATVLAEARVRVLRSLAAKSPAHRARYEAAQAALKSMIKAPRS